MGAAPPATSAPPDDTVLLAQDVDKTYASGTRALERASLRVARGDFVSLLGPSGCGKSTLLKLFAGLETPSSGQIRWWNHRKIDPGTPGQRIAMVFQEPTLMPWASVARNVQLPLDLDGVAAQDAAPRVARALAQVDLADFSAAYPRELSGGMQMRAALARALVTEPDLLLMDEPFGALDEFTRNRLDVDLRRLWAARDLTVLFVTHSIYEAVYLSNTVVMMAARPGRVVDVVEIEDPAERATHEEPATPVLRESPPPRAMRAAEFRHTAQFVAYCRLLSERLSAASQA